MTPQDLLDRYDSGALWADPLRADNTTDGIDVPAAYQQALAVRALRIARGEVPRGYKIGFTNRNIWPRYNVFAPIWGAVFDTTLSFCEGVAVVSLGNSCQPRIEPECVFGIKSTPAPGATLEDLFQAIGWVAPGFEIVQSHMPDWKFAAPDAVADGALHARLVVGHKRPVREIASGAEQLQDVLALAQVSLWKNHQIVEQGRGANVLDSPLLALQHFLKELRQCPGAFDLQAGDVVTTGTWTDAWPVQPGDHWTGEFSAPLSRLSGAFR